MADVGILRESTYRVMTPEVSALLLRRFVKSMKVMPGERNHLGNRSNNQIHQEEDETSNDCYNGQSKCRKVRIHRKGFVEAMG